MPLQRLGKAHKRRRGTHRTSAQHLARGRTRQGPVKVFDCWEQIARRVRAAKHLGVFLDFDGTLVPHRRRPEDIKLEESTRRVLRQLASHPRVTVCLISGRLRGNLRKHVQLSGISYLGLHGWDRDSRNVAGRVPPKSLRQAQQFLASELAGLPHVWIENKRLGFMVHYRGAAREAVRHTTVAVRKALEIWQDDLYAMEGKKGWEVLSIEVQGKGAAAKLELAKMPNSTLPVFIGDDSSDESAFEALSGAVTIRVGKSFKTKAHYLVRNPAEVRSFLEKVYAEIA
jgi:trehalose 6-phosphate phosphatase